MLNKLFIFTLFIFMAVGGTGCGARMARSQEMKNQWQAQKTAAVVVEYRSTGTAVGLSFLPLGVGAIYSQNSVGLFVCDLLFWPVSILWAPINNHAMVKDLNYDATVLALSEERKNKIAQLDAKRTSMSVTDYNAQRKTIDDYYRPMMPLEKSQ